MTVVEKPAEDRAAARPLVEAPRLDPSAVTKPHLLTVDDAKAIDVAAMTDLFRDHVNPGQLHFMKLLGFHKVKVERAEGMYYYRPERPRASSTSSAASARWPLATTIRASSKRASNSRKRSATRSPSPSCRNTRPHWRTTWRRSPGDLDMVFLGSSGSEAMEAAIKVAERAAGPKRPKIVYAENSFHGKTKGVLSITDGQLYRGDFRLVDNTVRVPFGDIEAIESAFRADPEIGVDRAGDDPGRRRHRPGAAGFLAGAAHAVRPVRRALGGRRGPVRYGRTGRSTPSSTKASCPTSPRLRSRWAAARRRRRHDRQP